MKGTPEWNFGFETPVTGCTFTGLQPATEYEVQVRTKTPEAKLRPVLAFRTDPACGTNNIIPFPKR